MATELLKRFNPPSLTDATMLLALSGWMDGGDVSIGTVQRLVDQLRAKKVAEIDSEAFYIFNFPGAMELAPLFRPHIKIKDGRVRECDLPQNIFYCDQKKNLAFFVGKEPNLKWRTFGECIFSFASQIGVSRIISVGSFCGTVPHTREPRLYASVSNASLKQYLQKSGVRPADYEGPGSFTSYLMTQAGDQGFEMVSLVAEIPSYLQGTNPLSIEAVTRRIALILGLKTDLAALRGVSNEWESQVSKAVGKDPELEEKIRELEKQYDDELLNTPMAPDWLNDEGTSSN